MARVLFGELLELADGLTLDEKETLLEILRQRTIQERRQQLSRDVGAARQEHRKGRSKSVSATDLIREINR